MKLFGCIPVKIDPDMPADSFKLVSTSERGPRKITQEAWWVNGRVYTTQTPVGDGEDGQSTKEPE